MEANKGSSEDKDKNISEQENGKEDQSVSEASGTRSKSEDCQADDLIGACGGCTPCSSNLLQEGVELCTVVPLPWCPHLKEVTPIPAEGINTDKPCLQCGNIGENWICLTCYEVHCSRYVNEHMLMHGLDTEHKIVLSFMDLSVWCYGCDAYVHNEILQEAKTAAHTSKFKEAIPQPSR